MADCQYNQLVSTCFTPDFQISDSLVARTVSIDSERTRLIDILQRKIDRLLGAVQACSDTKYAVQNFSRNLKAEGLWPPGSIFRNHNIRSMVENCGNMPIPSCECCEASNLQTTMDLVISRLVGLCLNCFQYGKISRAQGNCGAPKSDLCRLNIDTKAPSPTREM